MRVEVAYALPDRQRICVLAVEPGCTALEAVQRSGILDEFPEIDLTDTKMGIFSQPVANPERRALQDGDRVELYRPLLIDPKARRRERAESAGLQRKRAAKESSSTASQTKKLSAKPGAGGSGAAVG